MRHKGLNYLIATVLLISSLTSFAGDEQLVFALDLIRHGARTAHSDLPTAPHVWQEGKGQLTARGMQQEYQLGLQLHQRYITTHKLLAANYRANTVYVRSTDYDRTIMSAQSLLMGLYPLGTGPMVSDSTPALPNRLQPVPIHTTPAAQDGAFLIDIFAPELGSLLSKYVYSSADWQNKAMELSAHFARWSQLTGLRVENIFDVLNISDIVQAYVANDIALPEGLSHDEAKEIVAAGEWIQAALFKPTPVGEQAGKAALQKIVGYLAAATKPNSTSKFVLLSAHDVTTLGVMSALHAPLDSSPSYASDLSFGLYKAQTGDYLVKVTYNNQPVVIPACAGNVCQLTQLIEMAK